MSITSIREAQEKLGKFVIENPDKAAAKNVPATARLLGELRCEVKGPNGEILHTDMPPAVGGAASAPTPGWVLRASIAACTATAIAMRAAKQGVELTTLEVNVESASDTRGLLGVDPKVPAGFSAVRTRVKIGAKTVPADKLREIAKYGDDHSPMACTTRERPSYSLEIEVV